MEILVKVVSFDAGLIFLPDDFLSSNISVKLSVLIY